MSGVKGKSGIPTADLLRLDGIQIDKDGNEAATNFFNFLKLPEDHHADLSLTMTPEQALRFRNHVTRLKVGTSAAMPLLCSGAICPIEDCIFHEDKTWPIGKPCVTEQILIADYTKAYVENLNIDPSNRVEMVLVSKLVECDIIDYRANCYLSSDGEAKKLTRMNIAEGQMSSSETLTIHPLLDVKDRVHRIRRDILESFAATRRESYKRAAALKKREDETVGQHFEKMKAAITKASQVSSLDKMKKEAEELSSINIEDADWETSSD